MLLAANNSSINWQNAPLVTRLCRAVKDLHRESSKIFVLIISFKTIDQSNTAVGGVIFGKILPIFRPFYTLAMHRPTYSSTLSCYTVNLHYSHLKATFGTKLIKIRETFNDRKFSMACP